MYGDSGLYVSSGLMVVNAWKPAEAWVGVLAQVKGVFPNSISPSKCIYIFLRILLGAVPEKKDLYQGTGFYSENLITFYFLM